MELTVSTFDDDAYENMSYDERRNFNLARNREMMNLLFSGGSTVVNEAEEQKDAHSISVLVDTTPNEGDAGTLINKMMENNIFCRDKEILRLVQFLDQRLWPSQPLLVYGPVCSGKSLLCKTALSHITSSPYMTVSCTAVASIKQFIQGMWLDAFATVSKFNKAQLNVSFSFEENINIKHVSTFADLVEKMAALLYCQAHFLKQVNTNKVPGLIIMIDHIDKADELEDGLSRRLLCLHELCHPLIKVLAIGRALPRTLTANIMLLQLAPYTNAQLISIMCQKHNCEYGGQQVAARDSKLHVVNYSLMSADFKALCEQALPQFSIASRRVDSLWPMMQELFARRFGVKSSRYNTCAAVTVEATCSSSSSSCDSINESVAQCGSNNIISSSSSSSSGSSSSSSNRSSNHASSSIGSSVSLSGTKRSLEEDVKALVLLPAVHMPAISQQPPSFPINMQSYHGIGWFNHLPVKAKALALSAFLASSNPVASDRTTFGKASKGQRKKTKGDSEGAMKTGSQPQSFGVERLLSIYQQVLPSLTAAISNMPSNKYRRIRDVVSAGEVDKKISVFSVDAKKTQQKTKNEALLYAMINTLLKKRFLIAYATSTAGTKAVKMADSNNHILYLCTLQMNRAEELADSIGFPLKNYMCY